MTSLDTSRTTGLIGLDWGTTSLRAYRMDAAGRVLETRQRPWGIMRLPQTPEGHAAPRAGFELAFTESCGDWLDAAPTLPVIACGMVGSAQGWKEAAYLDVPLPLTQIGTRLTVIERRGQTPRTPVHVVPGLIQRQGLPNVMRGEETQVVGAVAGLSETWTDEELLVGLPGTHSKWVSVSPGAAAGGTRPDASVSRFETFMTGEVYAALREHTILGRTMSAAPAPDLAAFERGLRVAAEPAGAAGPLSTIFSTRTLGLTGALPPTSQADYLSGLLIGHEVTALAGLLRARQARPRILLCGEADLCQRYTLALRHHGLPEPTLAQQATERGLWRLALAAGLVQAVTTEAIP
ncbi:2-dehydro-3-deoxygalactonokinase [Hylemonella gracilis]|uniref:2-dehydro-3-deoxygalactonokinase n=1 Tax=Hylemonella gracilis TaxID=80880 RepID=A0A4V1A254_9BURK|nr:2-dehydro-3-deoxygalactonokinase [Hylemonella gracilis]QBK04859.1 2-dehydro-3-deoxygalactonokinase [Hylemonella gracilis]